MYDAAVDCTVSKLKILVVQFFHMRMLEDGGKSVNKSLSV